MKRWLNNMHLLKLNFDIKNIQNPLQRHYCRGQTILSFEQNLVEYTDESFVKTIKTVVKYKMGQTVIVVWSKEKVAT